MNIKKYFLDTILSIILFGSVVGSVRYYQIKKEMAAAFPEVDINVSVDTFEGIYDDPSGNVLILGSDDFYKTYAQMKQEIYRYLDDLIELYSNLDSFRGTTLKSDSYVQNELERLTKLRASLHFTRKEYNEAIGDLNLYDGENNPIFIYHNSKQAINIRLSSDEDFISALLSQPDNSISFMYVISHGNSSYLLLATPNNVFDYFFDGPAKYLSINDLLSLNNDMRKRLRKKFKDEAIVFLPSCNSLDSFEHKTTIGEALAYVLSVRVVACEEETLGWYIVPSLDNTSQARFTSANYYECKKWRIAQRVEDK